MEMKKLNMIARNGRVFKRNVWYNCLSGTGNVIVTKISGLFKGEADVLRKAMGKKQKSVLDKMKPKFLTQAEKWSNVR